MDCMKGNQFIVISVIWFAFAPIISFTFNKLSTHPTAFDRWICNIVIIGVTSVTTVTVYVYHQHTGDSITRQNSIWSVYFTINVFFFVLLFCFAQLGFPQSDTIDINFWRHFSVFLFVTQLNGIQFTLKLFGILITQIPNSLSAGTAKL